MDSATGKSWKTAQSNVFTRFVPLRHSQLLGRFLAADLIGINAQPAQASHALLGRGRAILLPGPLPEQPLTQAVLDLHFTAFKVHLHQLATNVNHSRSPAWAPGRNERIASWWNRCESLQTKRRNCLGPSPDHKQDPECDIFHRASASSQEPGCANFPPTSSGDLFLPLQALVWSHWGCLELWVLIPSSRPLDNNPYTRCAWCEGLGGQAWWRVRPTRRAPWQTRCYAYSWLRWLQGTAGFRYGIDNWWQLMRNFAEILEPEMWSARQNENGAASKLCSFPWISMVSQLSGPCYTMMDSHDSPNSAHQRGFCHTVTASRCVLTKHLDKLGISLAFNSDDQGF